MGAGSDRNISEEDDRRMTDKHVRQISNLTKKLQLRPARVRLRCLSLGPFYFTRECPYAVLGPWARMVLCSFPVVQGRPSCYSRAPVCGACLFNGFFYVSREAQLLPARARLRYVPIGPSYWYRSFLVLRGWPRCYPRGYVRGSYRSGPHTFMAPFPFYEVSPAVIRESPYAALALRAGTIFCSTRSGWNGQVGGYHFSK